MASNGKRRHERLSMSKADCANEPVIYRKLNGRCFFPITTKASSTGQLIRPINLASTPMFIPNLTRQVAR
jgi:hypothetical protein